MMQELVMTNHESNTYDLPSCPAMNKQKAPTKSRAKITIRSFLVLGYWQAVSISVANHSQTTY